MATKTDGDEIALALIKHAERLAKIDSSIARLDRQIAGTGTALAKNASRIGELSAKLDNMSKVLGANGNGGSLRKMQ